MADPELYPSSSELLSHRGFLMGLPEEENLTGSGFFGFEPLRLPLPLGGFPFFRGMTRSPQTAKLKRARRGYETLAKRRQSFQLATERMMRKE